jgi:RNA polymerase sigma-70 factor, ECF subfamily
MMSLAHASVYRAPMFEPDSELVRRIATGSDRDAEAELCRRYAPRIRLYGLRHLRSEDRARDLVQAVLLAVLVATRAGRVEDREHFERFVLGTCRNTAQRMRDGDARLIPAPAEELDVTTILPRYETLDAAALFDCLSRLEERARMVIYLSFHDERQPNEIAGALQTTLGNVRVLRHRAIKDLRECLGEAQ